MTILRRFFVSFCALGLLLASASNSFSAQAYIIADSKTGFIFQEHESKQKRQVGSLTKIATAMVVLDWAEKHSGDLSQSATIPPEAFNGVSENLIGFQPGDTITLRDALYAALVQSDNIAAYTLAKTLRMDRTLFVNPHGIDANVKPMPYSTALDMARLARYAMARPGFKFYVSQKERQISFKRAGKTLNYKLRNTNEMLGADGVDGVKTGTTASAGQCLILSAAREALVIKTSPTSTTVFPRRLIIVILGSANRFDEGRQFLNVGWQLYDQWAAAGRVVDPRKAL